MKFLLRSEFLTALAAWLVAAATHLGWDLPPELIYGGATVISIAAGGVAVRRNKNNGNGAAALMLLVTLGLALPACSTVQAGIAAGQQVLSRYIVVVKGEFNGKIVFNAQHVVVDGSGDGLVYLKDAKTGIVVFSYPVQGEVCRAWAIVPVDSNPPIAFRDADVDATLKKLNEAPDAEVVEQ